MIAALIITIITIILLITSVLFYPTIKIGKIHLGTYWIVSLLGAVALLIAGSTNFYSIYEAFTSETEVNPLKI
ncbi:MAG: hypothetical protein MJ238_01460 [Bacilli bacterium]|nr:hypothetical protein [Bacilli bacterium]